MNNTETKVCPHCAEEIKKAAKKCPKCQKDLRDWINRHPIVTVLLLILFIPSISEGMNISSKDHNTTNTIENIWEYKESSDKLDGDVSKFAILQSSNKLNFEFPYNGGSYTTITLRKKGNQDEVIYRVSKGQFSGSYGRKIRLKFDDNKPFYVDFGEPSSAKSGLIFLFSEDKIIEKLKSSEKLLIEVEYFNHGKEVSEFNVGGLEW